jgi:hypothetical protein
MTWSYSGDPSTSTKDEVRFLSGNTDTNRQLVSDEEVLYAISQYSNTRLAAALVLRALAAKFSRETDYREGDIAVSDSKQAEAFRKMADELDPGGITTAAALLALPSFGGLSKAEKDTLDSNTDAVQPSFYRGMNDIPGGPGDNVIDSPGPLDEDC